MVEMTSTLRIVNELCTTYNHNDADGDDNDNDDNDNNAYGDDNDDVIVLYI